MQSAKHAFFVTILSLITTTCILTVDVSGKSLYAITKHYGCQLSAYLIDHDQIDHQSDTTIDTAAVGLALDPDSETLFVTYDGTQQIVLVNAKTLAYIKTISTIDELAGIVYDRTRQKVCAVSRQDDELYVYAWDALEQSLTLDDQPTLLNISRDYGAYGLALDETDDVLYVTDATAQVKYYDASDPNFVYLGSIQIEVAGNDRRAVGIDVYNDTRGTKLLYTGAAAHTAGVYHDYLVRTDISDVNNPISTQRDVGASVVSAAVDLASAYVYVTTTSNHIEVYNDATFPTDPCDTETSNISGPADILVRGDVLYKEPHFDIAKDNNDPNNACVIPWDPALQNYLVFDICWDANGYSDINVVISDRLPIELDYYSSNPTGDYNQTEHIVTWNLGAVSADDSGCIQLTARVNTAAWPCSTVTNPAVIEGDNYIHLASCDFDICSWGAETIYVDADANDGGDGSSWQNAFNDLHDALTRYQNTCGDHIWVAAGTYKPTNDLYDQDANFALVDRVSMFGGFDGNETSLTQRRLDDPNTETILSGDINGDDYADSDYVVTAHDMSGPTTLDGFTMTYGDLAGLRASNSSLIVTNSTITHSHTGLDLLTGCSVEVRNSILAHNTSSGLYASACLFSITDSTIHNNAYGVFASIGGDQTAGAVLRCTISDNTSCGVSGDVSLSELRIRDN
jgi:hypothetical protein